MASEMYVDTIAASDGTSPATLTKQSAAKAWVNFNGTGTIAARDSYNLSSLTDLSTGQFTVNVANSFNNAGYSATASHSGNSTATVFSIIGIASETSSAMRYSTFQTSWVDREYNNVTAHGDLA